MESMKETITNWLKYFQDYINSFSFVENEKNIFYFSKFSLDISEFYLIHEFVKTLKENIFKENIEQFKYCVKNIIFFSDEPNKDNSKNSQKKLTDKERIIILFSACLFIYYKKFRFNTNCSFENYFDEEFINIAKTTFKFEIKNAEIFKIFAFYYFSIMQKKILELDYSKIKSIKKYYNYQKAQNNSEEDTEIEINNGSNQKVNEGFQEQVLTFLISAKEKMIDLVFETSNKNQSQNINQNMENLFPGEINDMNHRFQKLNNNLNYYINLENGDKNDYNNNNKKISDKNLNQINNDTISENKSSDNRSEMNIDDCSPQKPKTFNVNNNSINCMNNNSQMSNIRNDSHSNFISFMLTDFSNNNNFNTINNNSFNTNSNNNTINNSNYNTINTFNTINTNNISNSNISNGNNSINFNYTNHNINKNFVLNHSNSLPLFNNFESLFNFSNNSKKSINSNNNNIYSKRIISELIRSEFDNKTMEIIEEVSKIIDDKYLDNCLNTISKNVNMIQYFCCYMVEFTPDMLIDIAPQYKDVLKNFGIKFIVLAKELYNTTMEIFSTIYDLSYINFDAFIDLSKDCGIQLEHAQGLYKIFRDFSIILLNEKKKKGGNNNIMSVLRKLFDQENQNWTTIIKQKSNEFTNFFKV